MTPYQLRIAQWQTDAPLLRTIRETVFIREQHVPVELEWDEFDAVSTHILAFSSEDNPIGTARLLPDGHLGRMAVLKAWRGHGIGGAMLKALLDIARQRGLQQVILHAQVTARSFYDGHGFVVSGDTFIEAGITHVKMILKL